MTRRMRMWAAVLVLPILNPARADDEPAPIEAKAAFARLKTLNGDWKCTAEGTHMHGEARVNYRLTGAGSALVETQFPGQAHEMVSVYHLDGPELRMTHYCAAGNQPRFKLDRAKSKPDDLLFVLDGGTNFDPARDPHIHGLRVRWLDGGKVVSDWEAYHEGKPMDTTTFTIVKP